jgi:hypothetical protein
MSELPAWPNWIGEMSPCIVQIDGQPPQAFMHYTAPGERAYVDAQAYKAAMARLRKLHAALTDIAERRYFDEDGILHKLSVTVETRGYAIDALEAIGEIPEA